MALIFLSDLIHPQIALTSLVPLSLCGPFPPATSTMKIPHLALLVIAAAMMASGCSKSHDHASNAHAGHAHKAPHGGTLVELGDHAYNIELVRDRTAGKLTAWILDGHAEQFIRLKSPTLELIAMPGGDFTRLTLQAVANPATGETIGDTSQFEVQADWLKEAGEFAGIFTVEIKGTKFDQVSYSLHE